MSEVKLLAQWEKAKTEYEKITNKSKPKPGGTLFKAFARTGLTDDLKTADKIVESIHKGDFKKNMEKAKKHYEVLQKSAGDYITVLNDAIATELKDHGDQKTTHSRALKFLRASLDSCVKSYAEFLERKQIAVDQVLDGNEKAAKLLVSGITAAMGQVSMAVKLYKANPSAAAFNALFNKKDNVASLLHDKFTKAASSHFYGHLDDKLLKAADPKDIVKELEPWITPNAGKCVMDPKTLSDVATKRVKEFLEIVAKAKLYRDALNKNG